MGRALDTATRHQRTIPGARTPSGTTGVTSALIVASAMLDLVLTFARVLMLWRFTRCVYGLPQKLMRMCQLLLCLRQG